LLIVAGVAWLPAHARVAQARHERDRLVAKNADDESLSVAYGRLIAAIPADPVLGKRLAMRRLGFLPRNEMVIPTAARRARAHWGLVSVVQHRRPAGPNPRILRAAEVVRRPVTRAILMPLAVAAFLAAVALSAPPQKKPTQAMPKYL